jgi:glycosyltransferase involved in cell wall biosynthesis
VVSAPRVSVVMAVHDGARWLREAVDSALGQTLGDLELIVVDDGSTDATAEILAGYGDRRLSVVRQPRAGLTRSLNRGLRRATTPLLARLDADDVARPERLARQLAFLDAHPDVGLLGTGCREIDADGAAGPVYAPPAEDAAIRRALIRRNPFVHSSVVMRRSLVDKAGGYDETVAVAQDYDLWLRLSRVTRMANLPEPLVLRRLAPDRISLAREAERLRTEVRVKLRALGSGAYPLWCAVFLLKPLFALALPGPVRRGARAWKRGGSTRSLR